MRRFQTGAGLASAFAVAIAVGAQAAQDDRMAQLPEATIYRDARFAGPAVFIGKAEPDLGLAWPVNSVRVRAGTWELCERPNFGGNCVRVDRDTPQLGTRTRGRTVQSIRPMGGNAIPDTLIGVEARDRVTRGTFAEFHTQPESRGYRIPACPTGSATASCAARTADAYCRTQGWNGSAREHIETVERRAYLADVLCVRSNF